MKKLLYLLPMFFMFSAQAQLVLNENNFLRPYFYEISWETYNSSPALAVPTFGEGQTWVYSTIPTNGTFTEEFTHVNNTTFSNSDNCIEESTVDFEGMELTGIYYYDVNAEGYFQNGITANEFNEYIGDALPEGYGSENDSIFFEETDIVFESPYLLADFGSGYLDSWADTVVWEANFYLTIESFSFDHLPGAYQETTGQECEIVGEGTITLPYDGGTEIFPSLLIKTEEFRIDSFFLNGEPAAQALLDFINVTQGQVTTAYSYNFFVPGMNSYALRLFTNSNYSQVIYSRFNPDLPEPTGINFSNSVSNISVYPNPAKESLFITGTSAITQIRITDVQGKTIKNCILQNNRIDTSDLRSGVYFVKITTPSGVIVKRFIKE